MALNSIALFLENMRLLQINTTVNYGSTGRIAEDIGKLMIKEGHESYIAYGRYSQSSHSSVIKIGKQYDLLFHLLKSRLFDKHGFGSLLATKTFLKQVDQIKPDIIGLHNLHGYYLNVEILFNYLHQVKIPLIWTLHDCWPFTGHCCHFEKVNCQKWRTGCYQCPLKHAYPKSWFIDNSVSNFRKKQELFTNISRLHLVSPSKWLANNLKLSFLSKHDVSIINNGIDLLNFQPYDRHKAKRNFGFKNKRVLLGVASVWSETKGLFDFFKLHSLLDKNSQIVLVGLNKKQMTNLPTGIIGIERTENIQELAKLYSATDIFINPTYVDNFPTTNLEAIACGTPVITYNTGGSPETIDLSTGRVVRKGNLNGIIEAINELSGINSLDLITNCRNRAELYYNKDHRYLDYINLYSQLA